MPDLYAGIDSGKQGFASVVDNRGNVIETNSQPLYSKEKGDQFDIPAMNKIVMRWKELGVKLVVVELQTPQGGVRSSAQRGFFQAAPYFIWRSLLVAHGIPHQLVKDTVWKKVAGVMVPKRDKKKPAPMPLPKKATKEQRAAHKKAVASWKREDGRRLAANKKKVKAESVKAARNLFPSVDLRRTDRCKVPDDNKCESLLMAVAACRLDGGQS